MSHTTKNTETHIMQEVTNTVGYHESENKKEFEKGAKVAISKAIDYYEPQIKLLKDQVEYWKGKYESCEKDFFTLAAILNKYSPENNEL